MVPITQWITTHLICWVAVAVIMLTKRRMISCLRGSTVIYRLHRHRFPCIKYRKAFSNPTETIRQLSTCNDVPHKNGMALVFKTLYLLWVTWNDPLTVFMMRKCNAIYTDELPLGDRRTQVFQFNETYSLSTNDLWTQAIIVGWKIHL